ncbi:MAG: hypothetical protein NVSMB43_09180 [Pseudarthrobacter sp.]
MYEVIFSPTVRRDLQSAPPRIQAAIIEFVYRDLSKNPQRVGKALKRDLPASTRPDAAPTASCGALAEKSGHPAPAYNAGADQVSDKPLPQDQAVITRPGPGGRIK